MSLVRVHYYLLLLCLLLIVSKCAAIKCYVCGSDDDNISCSNFQVEDQKFSRDCGANGKSCRLTRKVNENIVLSRTCESLLVEDCKTANSIEYCYCTTDFCNQINPLDDEEENEELFNVEGSGANPTESGYTTKPNKSNQDVTVGRENIDLSESQGKTSAAPSLFAYFLNIFTSFIVYFIF